MPPIEGAKLQSSLVTTRYFIIIFGLGSDKAFQHSFPLQWMTIRAPEKVKAIILEQGKKIGNPDRKSWTWNKVLLGFFFLFFFSP